MDSVLDRLTFAPIHDQALRLVMQGALTQFYAFTLVLVRLSGLMMVGPIFGQRLVPGNLRALPGAEVSIKLTAKFEHFFLEALDFEFAFVGGSEAAEFLHVFFEALDFALALERRGSLFIFLRGAHYATL